MTVEAISQQGLFVGCNKQPFAIDHDTKSGVVAYGAGTMVALWTPNNKNQKGIYHTLKGHSKEVTCVRFIPGTNKLITCGEDSRINVFSRTSLGEEPEFQLDQTIDSDEFSGSVVTICVGNDKIFTTGSTDGKVCLWTYNDHDHKWNVIHSFSIQTGFFPLSLALQPFDNNEFIVAIGGTKFDIYIYTFTLSSDYQDIDSFQKSAALAGHEDWVKCLSFVQETEHEYILASGSQDRYIRLWRLRFNEGIDNSDEDSLKLMLLSNKQYKFNMGPTTKAAFSFEALIVGHDDWITGLSWNPSFDAKSKHQKLQLLSSSADTALMVWEMDHQSGIWICIHRLGELSIKGASTATGASGGFWSCTWFNGSDGHQYMLTNGRTGSIRMYKGEDNDWKPVLGVTGPVREITDIVWSIDGSYVMSTSLDQTTRLFAPWKLDDDRKSWHEFARPQIHGYDMTCIANITATKFISAGDEKVLRVFEMTNAINGLLNKFGDLSIDHDQPEQLPDTAALPLLGLSNKAANEQLEAGEASQQQEDAENNGESSNNNTNNKPEDVFSDLTTPPLEDYLQRYTLFPELEKLYGHGYELTCCETSPNGKLVATSSKSNSIKHGAIRVFNVAKDYNQCEQTLPGHTLTITNLEFSPCGQYLLSVSRDRQYCVWRVVDEDNGTFELVEKNEKAHTRIIWDCTWLPQTNSISYFVTVSRDKSLKVWKLLQGEITMVNSKKFNDVITAVDCFKPQLFNSVAVLVIGFENGSISVVTIDISSSTPEITPEITPSISIPSTISPDSRITKLSLSKKLVDNSFQLAVGSADSCLRLYTISRQSIGI